ncbi:MAG: hypothetical protein HGN29_10720 [Asgard group archaeon]|nr:hypothetical protein [Asgard group archaeon]
MISITIATKNLRFLYTLNEVLSDVKEIKTNHILPRDSIPPNTDIIITTETEKQVFAERKVFVPKAFNLYYLYSNLFLLKNDKKMFERVVIGIDPGKTIGFAVLANNDLILGTAEFFSAVDSVKEVIKVFFNVETNDFIIKVGEGGGVIREEIVKRIEEIFREKIVLEVVKEDFTSKNQTFLKDKNYSKNVKSAILITRRR